MNRQLKGSSTARTCVAVSVGVVLPVIVAASAHAQGVVPGATERFEAASIKQNKDPVSGLVPRGTFEVRPGRFQASQATLQELISTAYQLFDYEIVRWHHVLSGC
jgi:hypothetical protein